MGHKATKISPTIEAAIEFPALIWRAVDVDGLPAHITDGRFGRYGVITREAHGWWLVCGHDTSRTTIWERGPFSTVDEAKAEAQHHEDARIEECVEAYDAVENVLDSTDADPVQRGIVLMNLLITEIRKANHEERVFLLDFISRIANVVQREMQGLDAKITKQRTRQ